MAKVRITALSAARELVGWSSQEVEFEGEFVRDLLKQVYTKNGSELYQVITEDDQIKGGLFILLNGRRMECWDVLDSELKQDDHIVVMEVMKIVGGG